MVMKKFIMKRRQLFKKYHSEYNLHKLANDQTMSDGKLERSESLDFNSATVNIQPHPLPRRITFLMVSK